MHAISSSGKRTTNQNASGPLSYHCRPPCTPEDVDDLRNQKKFKPEDVDDLRNQKKFKPEDVDDFRNQKKFKPEGVDDLRGQKKFKPEGADTCGVVNLRTWRSSGRKRSRPSPRQPRRASPSPIARDCAFRPSSWWIGWRGTANGIFIPGGGRADRGARPGGMRQGVPTNCVASR
jgi:hypothetical protein